MAVLHLSVCWPANKKHKCLVLVGLGFSRKKSCPPIPLLAAAQRMIRTWFAVSFCVLVVWGNKSGLMGQGRGHFLLNWLFFFPNPDTRRERENKVMNKYIYSDVFTRTSFSAGI